jgi:hypothetical protein
VDWNRNPIENNHEYPDDHFNRYFPIQPDKHRNTDLHEYPGQYEHSYFDSDRNQYFNGHEDSYWNNYLYVHSYRHFDPDLAI